MTTQRLIWQSICQRPFNTAKTSHACHASAAGHKQWMINCTWQLTVGNNHEEADTFLIHHAVLASRRNPSDAQLIFPWHRCVGARCIWDFGSGTNIENSGCRAKALPAFHAFTGPDYTEIFSRIRNSTWWNRYSKLVMVSSRLWRCVLKPVLWQRIYFLQ